MNFEKFPHQFNGNLIVDKYWTMIHRSFHSF